MFLDIAPVLLWAIKILLDSMTEAVSDALKEILEMRFPSLLLLKTSFFT